MLFFKKSDFCRLEGDTLAKKILLVGGSVLKAHLDNDCFESFNIVKEYFGMSPFSLGEFPRTENISKDRLTLRLRYDINNDFKGFLKKNPAKYIFIDLQKILADLIEIDGKYCTNQPENEDEFYTSKQDSILTVTDFKYKDFYDKFDGFIEIIKSYFKSNKIILLSSYVPVYYTVGRQVRVHKNKFKYNKWYLHFEKRFVEKTGCIYYDKSRFYFNEKRRGESIKYAVFENEYYNEAKRDFLSIIKRKRFSDKADYNLSVKRYVRYYPTLDKKFLNAFLSDKDSVDKFLMSCPEKYVLDNSQNFFILKNNKTSQSLLSKLSSNDFLMTYNTFLNISENSDYKTENIDLIFKNKIRIPQLLKYVRNESSNSFPKQITYYNYGYFYHKNPQKMPIVVDVVGSCVSRFIFNFNEKDFVVNNYAFHYMPIMSDKKVSYPENLFSADIWEHRMMKLQADCALQSFVNKNKAEWVVVDLFPLIELTAFMLDGKPIGSAGHFGLKKKLEEISVYERFSEDIIISELKKYSELLKSLYGDKIILIASQRQVFKVNDIELIVPYTNKEVNSLRNKLIRKFEKAFLEFTNCYYVNIVNQFFSDDSSFVSLSPVHYEDECYIEEGKIIKKIIRETPSEKVFTEYDVDTRINRILRFKKSGNQNEHLKYIFSSWQDEILLNLDSEQIEENYDALKSVYYEKSFSKTLQESLHKKGLY